MALDLNTVDLGAVDALAALKVEQDQLGERLKAMTSKRDQVSAEVYERVHGDYRRRLDELMTQAAPLKQRAGESYRALRAELANLEKVLNSARLDREELDFRHALGEFDAAELKQRVKAVDARVEEHSKAHARALSLKERFLSVVSGETELEASDDDTARMEAINSAPAAPAADAAATMIAAPIKGSAVVDVAATIVGPPMLPPAPAAVAAAVAPTPAATPARPPAARPPRNPDATVVFRQGRLEPRNAEAGSVVQTLGLKPVCIGSDSTCDLQLSAPGVAKRHVEISMTRAGFNLRDVAASGSVKINGSIVQEHVLSEGDTLSLGPAQFNFRLL
jgi:hypothetical protein